jgi:hypothetical protein
MVQPIIKYCGVHPSFLVRIVQNVLLIDIRALKTTRLHGLANNNRIEFFTTREITAQTDCDSLFREILAFPFDRRECSIWRQPIEKGGLIEVKNIIWFVLAEYILQF